MKGAHGPRRPPETIQKRCPCKQIQGVAKTRKPKRQGCCAFSDLRVSVATEKVFAAKRKRTTVPRGALPQNRYLVSAFKCRMESRCAQGGPKSTFAPKVHFWTQMCSLRTFGAKFHLWGALGKRHTRCNAFLMILEAPGARLQLWCPWGTKL